MVLFMNRIATKKLTFFLFLLLVSTAVFSQISAPGASGSDKSSYPVFAETDSLYFFCGTSENDRPARLQARSAWQGSKTYLWEKYNPVTSAFEFHFSESTENPTSNITSLENGCYRVTITQAANSVVRRAWVFNNWYTATASITESNCNWFRLSGEFTGAQLSYFDLQTKAEIQVVKDVKVQWKTGETVVSIRIDPQIFSPPTKNTDYTLRVYDRLGCEKNVTVNYQSIVTRAKFTASPTSGEAPLIVTFTNQSENADPAQYEWFFFRNLDDIKREAEKNSGPIDSIEVVAFDANPVYTYENSGDYMVKLVSKKISEFHTCVDTAYLDDYILVDSSFVAVPNVFTPNGDGTNDEFIVKFWSMKSIEISIYNRWGKVVHTWKSSDVRGFENTWMETVWDGRLMGGRFASPGVYYYNVVGEGRDGTRRRAHGFFHLFRDKE